MKELRSIVRAFQQAQSEGTACALASVVAVFGSAYRRPGARMLITEDGRTTGGVSGGCLERDVILRARQVIERGESTLVTYDSTDEDDIEFGVGVGCGGVVHILIEPLPLASEPSPLLLAEGLLGRRESAVLATAWRTEGQTAVRAGSRLLVSSQRTLWNDLGEPELAAQVEADARQALQEGRSAAHAYRSPEGQVEVFLELLRPPVPLILFGGGEDAVPLVRLAAELGWQVTVVDGRQSAASRARFPQADAVLLCRPEAVRERVPLEGETVAVVMTHHYLTDRRLLELLLPSPVRYLGLLGPKSRSDRLLHDLEHEGVRITEAQRRRLYAPIGLDLGAESPAEIALAILAEIRAVLSGRSGGSLRDRPTPIHEAHEAVDVSVSPS